MNSEVSNIINSLSKIKGSLIYPRNLQFYTPKYGFYRITEYCGLSTSYEHLFRVHFMNTGGTDIYAYSKIKSGTIRDPNYPSVYGVGYLGRKRGYVTNDKEFELLIHNRWNRMLDRCYNKKNNHYPAYGGAGVRVSDRWHNFSNFLEDIYTLPGFDKDKIISGELTLDKDKLQQNIPSCEKVYSKETCVWLSSTEQVEYRDYESMRNPRTHTFKWIYGSEEGIATNVSKFAKQHNLYVSEIYNVLNGKKTQYKGYTFYKL